MNRFEAAKIKMVMKLKRMTRAAAVAEIARMDAARKRQFDGVDKDSQEVRFDCDGKYGRRCRVSGRKKSMVEIMAELDK